MGQNSTMFLAEVKLEEETTKTRYSTKRATKELPLTERAGFPSIRVVFHSTCTPNSHGDRAGLRFGRRDILQSVAGLQMIVDCHPFIT